MPLLKLPGRSSIITVQICPAIYWCLIFSVLLMCRAEELGRALSIIVFPWKNPALVLTSKGSCLSCGKVAECYFELEVHAEKQLSSLISTSECHSKWRETLHWLEGWLESGPTRSIILQPIDFQTHFPFVFFTRYHGNTFSVFAQNLWLLCRTEFKIMWKEHSIMVNITGLLKFILYVLEARSDISQC